jgi:ADP-ribosyl-[dinitrogen reductase] hydrolase
MPKQVDRARGCLYGQLIGDSLGSLVEFQSASQIATRYPNGVRNFHDGGTWNTIAGQPTDDSEMALALARAIAEHRRYDQTLVRNAYVDWLESGPFDAGNTVALGLRGTPNYDSQANGALMRISPLGIFSAHLDEDFAARFAREDAWITHPNEVTQDANVLYVLSIARTVREGLNRDGTYATAQQLVDEHELAQPIRQALERATHSRPHSYSQRQGWALIAFQNAFYQLKNASDFEEAIVDTIAQGGDTDTNAAICGALFGAARGVDAIPSKWREVIDCYEPDPTRREVNRPRPRLYWPSDAAQLADDVLNAGIEFANSIS